jgi:hypothetical protein
MTGGKLRMTGGELRMNEHIRQLRTTPILDNGPRLSEIADLTVQRPHKRRIDGLEHREHFIPDPVTLILGLKVAAVIPVRNLVRQHISLNLLPCHLQQWAKEQHLFSIGRTVL